MERLRELVAEARFDDVAEEAGRRRGILGRLLPLTYDADPLAAWRAVDPRSRGKASGAGGRAHMLRSCGCLVSTAFPGQVFGAMVAIGPGVRWGANRRGGSPQ